MFQEQAKVQAEEGEESSHEIFEQAEKLVEAAQNMQETLEGEGEEL